MARKTLEKNISYDDIKKKYYVNFDYGKDENGIRIKKTKTFDKKSEAKNALKEYEADKTKGELLIPKNITLSEWLYNWMDNAQVNREQTTIYGYKNIIKNHLCPSLGSILLQNLKPLQIQNYYTDKIKCFKLSSNTVRKHHDLLKMILDTAVNNQIIKNNPCDFVEPPKVEKSSISFYNLDELINLKQAIKGNKIETVVLIAMYTGLRRSEICGLKWSNINFDDHVFFVLEARTTAGSKTIDKGTKTESSIRPEYICDDLLEALQNERERQQANREFLGEEYIDSDYVIVMDNGKPYRPNYISELFTKFIKDNGLPHLTLHGLRHSFASLTNAVGISQFNASKMLGHSTPATTGKIYTHMYDQSHKEEMNIIGEALKSKKE